MAPIMVILDGVTADDIWRQKPASGAAGNVLSQLLQKAGLTYSSCYITTVCSFVRNTEANDEFYTTKKSVASKYTQPVAFGEGWVSQDFLHLRSILWTNIQRGNPSVILACGDLALAMLTGIFGGVAKWRGSHLLTSQDLATVPVVPTYSLGQLNKVFEWQYFASRDVQRVAAILRDPELAAPPEWNFSISPSAREAGNVLDTLLCLADKPLTISLDIETIQKQISCIGLAWDNRSAMCIPLFTQNGHFYEEEDEIFVLEKLRILLQHPNVEIVGQNFNYDAQFFARYLGYIPHCKFDTMLAQHALFPGIPKSLDFLASMYCSYYTYWKDDLNDYNKIPENLHQYWNYNCLDVCYTYECATVLRLSLFEMEREDQFNFLQELGQNTLRMMMRGIAINKSQRAHITKKLTAYREQLLDTIEFVLGTRINLSSPPQMQTLFYKILDLPVQRNRKTKTPTCDSKALAKLAESEPIVAPLIAMIDKARSCGVFISTFCMMPLDYDGRMRCSFNMAGAETYRFSSSANVFGSGGNLQNIPKGEEE
jgi:uracil-DNA glycosylase